MQLKASETDFQMQKGAHLSKVVLKLLKTIERKHGILPPPPPPPILPPGRWGILGNLEFSLAPEGAQPSWGLKSFLLLRGITRLSLLQGMGRAPPPLAKNLLIPPPPEKIPPVDSPQISISPHQRFITPTNNNIHVKTQ